MTDGEIKKKAESKVAEPKPKAKGNGKVRVRAKAMVKAKVKANVKRMEKERKPPSLPHPVDYGKRANGPMMERGPRVRNGKKVSCKSLLPYVKFMLDLLSPASRTEASSTAPWARRWLVPWSKGSARTPRRRATW